MDETAQPAAESVISAPPKPTLCLRVGITGHRRLPAEQYRRIETQVGEVLDKLEETLEAIADRSEGWFADIPPAIRLISPLASGADTLVGQAALARGWDLHVVTPFPIETYKDDFATAELPDFEAAVAAAQRLNQLGAGVGAAEGDRAAAYLAAGQAVLAQSDVLVAIWDGAAARGIGGTAMIIEQALRRGVPVIWVRSDEDARIGLVDEDFSATGDLSTAAAMTASLLVPPTGPAPTFYEERRATRDYSLLFALFEQVLGGRTAKRGSVSPLSYAEMAATEWAPVVEAVRGIGGAPLSEPIERVLLPRYGWADNLANYYGGLYRSSYVANFLLSAVAVALALAEILTGFGKEIFIALETVVILTIAAITIKGRRGQWHEKWIDYRQLAEHLRQSRFLYLTGAALGNTDQRAYDGAGAGFEADAGRSWTEWYVRASQRELGVPSAVFDARYADEVRSLFLAQELVPQQAYHEGNAHRQHHLEHRLHQVGDTLFAGTLATCIIFLAAYVAYDWLGLPGAKAFKYAIKPWVTVLTAFFPALGAALLGIRIQGEFGSTAERSTTTAARLDQIAADLSARREVRLADLRPYVEAAADTMLAEVSDWRFVYRGKPLALPA